MVGTTSRYLAILGVVTAVASSAAQAEVMTGTAVKIASYQARGGTEVTAVGALAPSLQGKPVVVRIHADWCSACKATQSTIDALKQTYAGKINFIQFDVTNAKTAGAARAQAQQLGLDTFFEAAKTATSTVAVIDPENGKVYATLYNDSSAGDYASAIDAALKAETR